MSDKTVSTQIDETNNMNNTNSTNNERKHSENEMKEIMLLNWFSSSTLSILKLLRESMETVINDGAFIDLDENICDGKKYYEMDLESIKLKQIQPSDLTSQQKKNFDKFMSGSLSLMNKLKDEDFEFGKFIKKAFKILQTKKSTDYLLNEDFNLFKQKDSDNKYITIIKGVDIRFGCKFLTNTRDKTLFWQHMNLFSVAIFRLIEFSNKDKMKKYKTVKPTTLELEKRIAKSGLIYGDGIFNPLIGIHELGDNYSIDDLFYNVEKSEVSGNGLSINSVLKLMGMDKILSSDKLKEELEKINDEDIDKATDIISQLFGEEKNDDSKEIYGTLIKDMIDGFKKNGLDNPEKTLNKLSETMDKKLNKSKLEKTMNGVSNFLNNGEENLKKMKDKDGNPVGEKIMEQMKGPMDSLKGLSKKDMQNPMNLLSNLSGIMKSMKSMKKSK
jgi:hypothetical protein